MGYEVRPFQAIHVDAFAPQPAQLLSEPPSAAFAAVETVGNAFTGFKNGVPIVCAGYIDQWPGRALCWARIAEVSCYEMLWIHRGVSKFIADHPRRRLEMTVDAEFHAGHKWARMLGFTQEALLRSFDPTGRDHVLYARIT